MRFAHSLPIEICRRKSATVWASDSGELLDCQPGPAQIAAFARRPGVVPGRLDQQAAGVAGARLGDRALPTALTARVLRGRQAEVAHQPRRAGEALEVTDLGAETERREGVDAA